MPSKRCQICNKLFTYKDKKVYGLPVNRQFCSRVCSARARTELDKRFTERYKGRRAENKLNPKITWKARTPGERKQI